MSARERTLTESSLPIYHRTIDWDALYRRYPVPDVFANTRWKWSADEIRAFQNEQFLDLMKTGWENEFYKRRWRAEGLEPGDIKSIDDIVKLPTFDSGDIKKDQEENPPFGLINGDVTKRMQTTPMKLQTSGGTTGKPRPTLYAPQEWELNGLTHARVLYICGVRPGDRVQIPHTCSLGNAGWCCYKACHDYLGALPITTGTGAVTSSRRQIEIAQEWGTNVWYVRPEYATQLAKVARDELNFDVRDLKTKFLGCGLGPDTDNAFRNQLESLWGCDVYDMYGTHEMGMGAFECQPQVRHAFPRGQHFLRSRRRGRQQADCEWRNWQHGLHDPAPSPAADDPVQSARSDTHRLDRTAANAAAASAACRKCSAAATQWCASVVLASGRKLACRPSRATIAPPVNGYASPSAM